MGLNKSTLSQQIYDILREDILKQNIHCGEKLTLNVLKERFQVSSTPIREALTRLAQDGLATYYSNIGITVIEPDRQDLKELYEFIGDLDSLAIRYASVHPKRDELVAELEDSITTARRFLDEERLNEWHELSDSFHLIFYKYCHNSRLLESASRIRSQLTIFSNQYSLRTDAQSDIQKQHEEIFQSCHDGDITTAMDLMRSHVINSLQYALECLV